MNCRSEVIERYTCPSCRTTMDAVLKPEQMGRCPYCSYVECLDRRMNPIARVKEAEYSLYGNCKECGVKKEIIVSGLVYCAGCKLKKGNTKYR